MNRSLFRIVKTLAIALTLAALAAVPASAFRQTFVSSFNSSDANPCTATQPCQTFQAAIAQTDNFGEVTCLGPGNFGTVNIPADFSLTLNGGADSASIVVTTGRRHIQTTHL